MVIKTSDYEIEYTIGENIRNNVIILPHSINEDFKGKRETIYPQSSLSIFKKLNQRGISTLFAVGVPEEAVYIENRSNDWFGPTLFFSFSLLSHNPQIVSISINLLSSYIYDIFKGKNIDPVVKCSFVWEKGEKTKKSKIQYEGPVSGLKEVEKIINGKQ